LLFDVKNGQLTKPKSEAQEHKQEEQEQNTSKQGREQNPAYMPVTRMHTNSAYI
jgi:hypothetical protein